MANQNSLATPALPPGVPPLPPGVTLDPTDEWAAFPRVPALPPGVPPLPPGVTLDPTDEWAAFPRVPAPTWGDTAIDSAKGIGKGLAQGAAAIPGMVGDAATGLNSGIDSVERLLGASPLALAPGKYTPNTQNISDVTGASSLPDATTGTGKTLQNVAQFVPGALTPGGEGSWMAKALKFGVAPGLASEGAGALADAGGASPGTKGAAQLAASLLAPGVAGRVVSPLQNPDRAHAANIAALRDEGVQATAGQTVDSKPMQYLEATLNSNRNAEQQAQINRAALGRVGIAADRLTPGQGGTVDTMLSDIGGRFDRLQTAHDMRVDAPLVADLNQVHSTYLGTPGLYGADTENAVHGALTRAASVARAGGGTIAGADYQTLRSNLQAAAQGSSDPQRARALGDIVESLDDAMGRSVARTNPNAAGEWDRARRDYRNALVIEKAAGAAGPAAARGDLTPANLASAAKAVYGKRVYLRGQDDFSALTQPAASSLPTLPDSGTVHRAAITGALAAIGGGAGYALGSKYNTDTGNDSPVSGLLLGEGLGGALLPRLLGRPVIMNPATQAYLRNQAMTHTPGLLSLPGALTAANGARGLPSPGQ